MLKKLNFRQFGKEKYARERKFPFVKEKKKIRNFFKF